MTFQKMTGLGHVGLSSSKTEMRVAGTRRSFKIWNSDDAIKFHDAVEVYRSLHTFFQI